MGVSLSYDKNRSALRSLDNLNGSYWTLGFAGPAN